MKKLALVVIAIAVAAMFAGIADAAMSSSCSSCAKPCKPCVKPCAPCAKPCAPICVEYKRDVLGQKVPLYTYTKDGSAMTDKATQYENTLISGQ
ncbi:MAG: hypothetical protein NC938_07350 [Candidatus Omnitrophica bacterium]|nr:hypothetical protein [Candidatus Omnitrophota bacterium]